jgi:hypothetical protein
MKCERRDRRRRLEALLAFRERARRRGDLEAVALAQRLISSQLSRLGE